MVRSVASQGILALANVLTSIRQSERGAAIAYDAGSRCRSHDRSAGKSIKGSRPATRLDCSQRQDPSRRSLPRLHDGPLPRFSSVAAKWIWSQKDVAARRRGQPIVGPEVHRGKAEAYAANLGSTISNDNAFGRQEARRRRTSSNGQRRRSSATPCTNAEIPRIWRWVGLSASNCEVQFPPCDRNASLRAVSSVSTC